MFDSMTSAEKIWLWIGFGAQGLFGLRLVVQWIVSERKGKSVLPVAFWWLSLLGGSSLLSYAIYRRDPVFMLGQAGGLLIYVRNLVLVYRTRAAKAREREARAEAAQEKLGHEQNSPAV